MEGGDNGWEKKGGYGIHEKMGGYMCKERLGRSPSTGVVVRATIPGGGSDVAAEAIPRGG